MAELIWRDLATGQTISSQVIRAEDRYAWYEAVRTGECQIVEGKRFRMVTAAWKPPDGPLIIGCTFESWVYLDDD